MRKQKIIFIRPRSRNQAKKEIISYLQKFPESYPSDIAAKLELDMQFTMNIIQSLLESKKIEVLPSRSTRKAAI